MRIGSSYPTWRKTGDPEYITLRDDGPCPPLPASIAATGGRWAAPPCRPPPLCGRSCARPPARRAPAKTSSSTSNSCWGRLASPALSLQDVLVARAGPQNVQRTHYQIATVAEYMYMTTRPPRRRFPPRRSELPLPFPHAHLQEEASNLSLCGVPYWLVLGLSARLMGAVADLLSPSGTRTKPETAGPSPFWATQPPLGVT
jgi:hypothetical protein